MRYTKSSSIISHLAEAANKEYATQKGLNRKQSIAKALSSEPLLIQAPMAVIQDSKLAIAVSQAGGLGSIPCATLSIEQILENINACKHAGFEHVNINFFCHTTPLPDPCRMQTWSNELQPHFAALNTQEKNNNMASRAPISQQIVDELSLLKPTFISFHFGLPSSNMVTQMKEWGAIIIATATSVEEGIWLENNGADIVIAQGLEAGGHRGMFLETDISEQQTTFCLLPKLVKHLDIPVIAAGGISNKQAVRAAMALGASGVQVGTSYLLCDEVNTSHLHRAILKSPQAEYTCLTNVFTGKPARSIVNKATRELGPMSKTVPEFPLASIAMNQLKQAAEAQSLSDYSPLWSGQNNTDCKEISATLLTEELLLGFKN